MPSLIGVSIWHEVGYYMIIFLAGLQAIPYDLYEAAKLDGASTWRLSGRSPCPCCDRRCSLWSSSSRSRSLQVFDLPFILTQGGPVNSTNTLVMYMYETAFKFLRMGRATAMAVDALRRHLHHDDDSAAAVEGAGMMGQLRHSPASHRQAEIFLLIVGTAIMLSPFAWMILSSIMSSSGDPGPAPDLVPGASHFDAYRGLRDAIPLGRMYINSVFVTTSDHDRHPPDQLLGRLRLRQVPVSRPRLLFMIVLATMMIPFFVVWCRSSG